MSAGSSTDRLVFHTKRRYSAAATPTIVCTGRDRPRAIESPVAIGKHGDADDVILQHKNVYCRVIGAAQDQMTATFVRDSKARRIGEGTRHRPKLGPSHRIHANVFDDGDGTSFGQAYWIVGRPASALAVAVTQVQAYTD